MKTRILLFFSCFIVATNYFYSQVGINNDNPTEELDVNGTTRLRGLPLDGEANAINTKSDGTKSSSQDQTFTAKKALVVDANGVIGTLDGLPITEAPEVKTIKYTRVSTTIDANTPTNSVTTIGNLSIRYNSSVTTGGNWIEFRTTVPNNVTCFADVSGNGGGHYNNWRTTAAAANTWYIATLQGLTASNRDTYNLWVTLNNSQQIYRVSLIVNADIPASTTPAIPAVPAQVIIFVEQLE